MASWRNGSAFDSRSKGYPFKSGWGHLSFFGPMQGLPRQWIRNLKRQSFFFFFCGEVECVGSASWRTGAGGDTDWKLTRTVSLFTSEHVSFNQAVNPELIASLWMGSRVFFALMCVRAQRHLMCASSRYGTRKLSSWFAWGLGKWHHYQYRPCCENQYWNGTLSEGRVRALRLQRKKQISNRG